MGTTIRPELSKNNEYWISKHRYYELKHFCLQYYEWKKKYKELSSVYIGSEDNSIDPTGSRATEKVYYETLISMVDDSIRNTDTVIGRYIFEGVTRGLSYSFLHARYNVPFSKEIYYKYYRKFFSLLDKIRR